MVSKSNGLFKTHAPFLVGVAHPLHGAFEGSLAPFQALKIQLTLHLICALTQILNNFNKKISWAPFPPSKSIDFLGGIRYNKPQI